MVYHGFPLLFLKTFSGFCCIGPTHPVSWNLCLPSGIVAVCYGKLPILSGFRYRLICPDANEKYKGALANLILWVWYSNIVVGIIYISPCCGLCLRRVSLNLENLRPTHEQNTSFGNLDQHFFTIMSSKMVMFQKKTTNQLGPLQHPHPGMKLEVSTCSADPIDLWYNMAMRNPLKIGIWIGNLSTNGGCPMAMFDYQRAIGLWLGVS